METTPSPHDLELTEAFAIIESIPTLSPVIKQIVGELKGNTLNQQRLQQILLDNKLDGTEDIKPELIDLLLLYTNLVLNDHIITPKEYLNCKQLKILFNVRKGDFYRLRYEEIKEVIYKQLERIYRDDNKISDEEAIHKINLQGLFYLSYDQFLEFNEREIRIALEKGADIKDLDTVRYPLKISHNEEANGVNLFQEIKDIVWERDVGVCTQCKSNRDIGFFPIIPFEKGGSSTYRNMRLLCENCNGV
jgi:hypothetical protein